MRLIQPSETDKRHWDTLVASAIANGRADVFAYSWYLDACAQDWCILADDAFENGIALPFTVKLGVKAISPPIFVRNLDFMGSDDAFPLRAMAFMWQHFKVAHLQLASTFDLSSSTSDFRLSTFDSRTHQTISASPILNSQANRMIKKASKNGITVQETANWKPVLEIIRQELSEKISEFTPENLQRLEKLVSALEREKQLHCLGIYRNGILEGGMIFMDSANKRVYLKGAATRETRDMGGMYLCMHEAILQAIGANKLFDFGGSEVEGVRRFNLNLGGTDRHYYIYSWNNAPWWFNFTKQMYQKWKKK